MTSTKRYSFHLEVKEQRPNSFEKRHSARSYVDKLKIHFTDKLPL